MVSVQMVFEHKKKSFLPRKVLWSGRVYMVDRVTLRHPVRKGRELSYVFSVVAGGLYMRLRFETESLAWFLEEVDGE